MTNIPEWAKRRACDLANENHKERDHWKIADVGPYSVIAVIANLVMKYEQPPVDPLLVEARKICAEMFFPGDTAIMEEYLAGQYDKVRSVQSAYAALKRGIEMAGEA